MYDASIMKTYYHVTIGNSNEMHSGPQLVLSSNEEEAEKIAAAWEGADYVSQAIPALGFISRHAPTPEQRELAWKAGYHLAHLGDVDAFDCVAVRTAAKNYAAIAAVHPAVFMHLLESETVSFIVFENGTRAAEGGPPSFYAKAMHVWHVGARSFNPDFPDEEGEELAVTTTHAIVI